MACNQDQIKEFPWTPERVASLFANVRDNYLAKGVTDFGDVVKGLSAEYGIKPEIIVKGLSRPESGVRHATNEMWLKAQRQRSLEQQARAVVPQMETSKWASAANKVLNFPRRVTLFGHFAAFTKSHLSDHLFYNPGEYGKNFTQSWHLATKEGRVAHETEMASLFSDADPRYVAAKRAQLDNQPGGAGGFRRETAEVTGKNVKLKKEPQGLVDMAFDQLRMTRQRIWNKEWAHLTPEEQANSQGLKDLAAAINHDTGATERSNAVARFVFLSPRLFPAQLAHVFRDIPKALFDTGANIGNWKNVAPASRYVARKTAILAAAQTGILAANYGIAKAVGALGGDEKKFMPNLTKFQYDFGRARAFGYSIPTSPTVELAKVPFTMIAAGWAAKNGDNRMLAGLKEGLKTILGRQNPLFTYAEEALFGQNPISGQPIPQKIPGTNVPTNLRAAVMGPSKATKGKPEQEWVEYAGTKMPIFMANYAREFNDELKAQGMSKDQSEALIKAAVTGTIEAATSYHLSPDHPHPPKTTTKVGKMTH